jgi:hypothetical protein
MKQAEFQEQENGISEGKITELETQRTKFPEIYTKA